MTRLLNIFRPVLGVGLGLAMQSALAAVGARVLVQVWNPLTPKQQSGKCYSTTPADPVVNLAALAATSLAQMPSALH